MTHIASALLSLLLCLAPIDGWLGIYLDPSRDEPRVLEVIPDSPAAKAGLRTGDVIASLDGTATTTRDEFITAIRAHDKGEHVRLQVERDGKTVQVVVTLGERPPEGGTPPASATEELRPGAPSAPRTEGAPPGTSSLQPRAQEPAVAAKPGRGYLGAAIGEGEDGVEIERVLDGSPAAAAGLLAGDELVRWQQHAIETLQQLDALVATTKPGDVVALEVRRGDALRRLQVTHGLRPTTGSGVVSTPAPSPTPAPAAAAAIELPFATDFAKAEATALAQHQPLLVLFGASWDGSSQAQRRALATKDVLALLHDHVCVYVDADQNKALLAAHKITDLPVLELWRDGAQQWRQDGFLPVDRLRELLQAGAGSGTGTATATSPPPAARPEAAPAGDAAVAAELQALRRDIEDLRRLLEELRKARSGGE